MEVRPSDLTFEIVDGADKQARFWFRREPINAEIVARRLVELAHGGEISQQDGQARIKLGTATLHGKRKSRMKNES